MPYATREEYGGKIRSVVKFRWLQQAGKTLDRNYFVVMILSILQDIWVGVGWVGL
jgi:hypothetical protein